MNNITLAEKTEQIEQTTQNQDINTNENLISATGTKVYAFMDGKVTFSGWNGGYGILEIIDHGNSMQGRLSTIENILGTIARILAVSIL